MAKRQVYSFEEKKYSANSIASAILSLLSVLILAGVLFVSFLMKGMANTWIGASRIYRHCDGVLRALVWICRVP